MLINCLFSSKIFWEKPVVRRAPVHPVQMLAGSCWTGQYSDCVYPALLRAEFHLSQHVSCYALNRGVAWNLITLHSPPPSNLSPFLNFWFLPSPCTAMQGFTHIIHSQGLIKDYKSHPPLSQRDLQISMEHNCGNITALVAPSFLPPAPKPKISTSVQTQGWRKSAGAFVFPPHCSDQVWNAL